MKRIDTLFATCLLLATISMAQAQQTTDVESIQSASQRFVAAIGARDINAMDKVWAHESYASFIGPLSTTVVIGWDGVRGAWQMRFGQFDRVTILANKPHRCLCYERFREQGRTVAIGGAPSDTGFQATRIVTRRVIS